MPTFLRSFRISQNTVWIQIPVNLKLRAVVLRFEPYALSVVRAKCQNWKTYQINM